MCSYDVCSRAQVEMISEKLGTATGLGYPTRQELEALCVKQRCEEGAVMAALKKQWKASIEMMVEIVAAAEIEEMLTPERCESFAFSRPVTPAEAQHVEALYLSDEFGRDREKVVHFLSQVMGTHKSYFQ